MNSKQTEEQQSLDEKIKGIVLEIFYAPATNDKSLESISNGIRKVKELLTEHTALPSKPVGDVDGWEHEILYMPTHLTSNEPDMGKIRDKVKAFQEKGWQLVQILVEQRTMIFKRKSGYAAAPQKGMKFVEWQLCPKCNGDGNLARYNSPSIIGTDAALLCDICKGAKMIPKIALDESPSPSEAGDGWNDEDWIKFIQWYAGMNRSSVLQGINQYKSQTPDQ